MALGDLFKLARLTILGFKDSSRADPPIGKVEVQYNPESLTLQHESVFQQQQGMGAVAAGGGFSHSKPGRLAVNLVLDGSKVDHMGLELLGPIPTVADRIKEFLDTCYRPQSETHEPAYLKLLWGKGVLQPSFDCRLLSVDVKYTSFDRDGSPLHAELAAVFVRQLDPAKVMAEVRPASPDLTHRRVVLDGDTLPLLCREIYGSPAHYLRVAEANGLDGFRRLTPGQELIFPPFEKARRS